MYYTGIDPRDMKPVYVARDSHEKALQRALLQWRRPEMKRLVIEALQKAGREDLIGYRRECLVRPLPGMGIPAPHKPREGGKDNRDAARKPGAAKTGMSKTDLSKEGAPKAGASRDGAPQPHRDGRGPKPAGTVHRGKKNTPGRKPPMPAAKKKALAARRAGK